MKIKLSKVLLCLLISIMVSSGLAYATETNLPPAQLTKLTDNVYAYVGIQAGTPGDAFLANVGVIIGNDGVLVVDTLTSAKEAELLLANIRKVTDKPIRYVVNTHYHLDHAMGNCVFVAQGAQIISHKKCRESLLQTGAETMTHPENFGLTEDFFMGTTIAAPTITFDKEMQIDLGGMLITLTHSGYPSHSPGSIFVTVPEQSVVFTGDIVFTDFHPFLGEGDLDGWNKTLDQIEALQAKYIIPGHGPLSTVKDLTAMREYLVIFDKNAKKLSAEIEDPQKLAEEMKKVLPQRTNGDFIISFNLQTRYLKPVK